MPSSAVYGRHPVYHLLKAGRRRARQLYILKGSVADPEIASLSRQKGVPLTPREESFFTDKFGKDVVHQGICVETNPYPFVDLHSLLETSSIVLLDGFQDPQNFGALCRSAYLMGLSGVVIPERRAVGITPSVCKAAAGAVEYLKIAMVTSLPQALQILKEASFWIYGADPAGGRLVFEEKFPAKTALVIGGEGKGLARLVRERCDILLKIPMSDPEFGSLNASASGAILLYEWARQKMCQK